MLVVQLKQIGAAEGMGNEDPSLTSNIRVQRLLAAVDSPNCSAADVLCDRHDPASIAYRVVRADRSVDILTYGELRAESERFASALSSIGIKPGDRVATLMGKSRAYLVALMGIWRLGAVHVPLFTAFAPPAIAMRLFGSGAKAVICDPGQQPKLAPGNEIPATSPWRVITTGQPKADVLGFGAMMAESPPPVSAPALGGDAPLIHIYTSGTTGKSKGVLVPLRAVAACRAYAEFGLDLRPDDLYWCAADPGWAYGLYFGILASFATGTPSLLLEGGFAPETTLDVLGSQGVTNFSAAPTVYRALRNANLTIPRGVQLRCASSAGEPLTPEVNEWAVGALGVPVHDHYGQTEAGMLINNHHHPLLKRPIKPGSMGQPMPGWTAVVLHKEHDEPVGPNQLGRVAMDLAGSPLAWFSGYHEDPAKSAEKFTADGRWYLTGDTGWMDEEGYFYFSAREDDVIIMAGYRIGPFEVESVIATHPAVAESAVIAVPDTVRGEVIEAYVVVRPGVEETAELALDIQQWVKTRYAAHAYPRMIHFAEMLPKTPSGKVQRFLLRQRRRAELARADA
jgi:acetyl-CoA synthetase